MYNIDKNTYSCDVCGFEEAWDAHDDIHGDLWECECCGAHFCTACFVKEVGREAFDRMMRESDRVLCVTHFKEEAHEEEKQGKASGASPKKKVFESDRYKMAKSCQYCTDTGDSFDRYVSTYCHLKHEHMFGFSGKDTLSQCFTCKNYKKRENP